MLYGAVQIGTRRSYSGCFLRALAQDSEFGTAAPPTDGAAELPPVLQNDVVTITPALLYPGAHTGKACIVSAARAVLVFATAADECAVACWTCHRRAVIIEWLDEWWCCTLSMIGTLTLDCSYTEPLVKCDAGCVSKVVRSARWGRAVLDDCKVQKPTSLAAADHVT